MTRRALLAFLALLAALLALPGPSHAAAAWRTEPDSETAGTERTAIRPGEILFLFTNDATATGIMLNTDKCLGGAFIEWDSNTGSASATAASTLALFACPTATFSTSTCNGIYFDVDGGAVDTNALTGEASLGKAALYGLSQRWLGVTVTNAATNNVQAVIGCK